MSLRGRRGGGTMLAGDVRVSEAGGANGYL